MQNAVLPEHREIAARLHMEIFSALANNVYMAGERSSAFKFVLKFYDGVSEWERETAALDALSDAPNIVRVHSKSPDGNPAWLALDYVAGGDLFEHILEVRFANRRLEYDQIRIFARDVLTALSHVHGVGLVHLDLKPENIYLQTFKGQTRAILADFGTAHPADLVVPKIEGRTTPPYAPPEHHHSPVRISPAFDIWSLGSILYLLFTFACPFEKLHVNHLPKLSSSTTLEDIEGTDVLEGLKSTLADNDTPRDAMDAIMGMLRFNPEDRVTVADLNRHTFFSLELEPVVPVGARQAVKDQTMTLGVPEAPPSSPYG
jgi:serine/threonine protein kinase